MVQFCSETTCLVFCALNDVGLINKWRLRITHPWLNVELAIVLLRCVLKSHQVLGLMIFDMAVVKITSLRCAFWHCTIACRPGQGPAPRGPWTPHFHAPRVFVAVFGAELSIFSRIRQVWIFPLSNRGLLWVLAWLGRQSGGVHPVPGPGIPLPRQHPAATRLEYSTRE